MASDASALLGAAELAGSFVSPKGLTKTMTGATAAGVVGGLAGRLVAGQVSSRRSPAAPSFGQIGYIAVTAEEFAIVRGKTGLMKPSVGKDVVERVPRSEIAGAELGAGMLKAPLIIRFVDGGSWEFEIPKVYRKTAARVADVLNGRAG
jgi:hypothetical protein